MSIENPNPTPQPALSLQQIQQHCDDLLALPDTEGLFIIKPASRWIADAGNRPKQKMLFATFWFEGELCILFADTNQGKSILAVQLGDSISRGAEVPGFVLQTEAQPVLYFDFELNDQQFQNRYSVNNEQAYPFHPNFLRIELNPTAIPPKGMTYEDYLCASLERAVTDNNAKVLIIDNLTYLRAETEQAKDALPLMKELKALKIKYDLSILVLAHTPKRDMSKPITRNDLSGSKMLINFCDSAFAIGESFKDKNLRYIKQIKQRNTEQMYGGDNVVVCQVIKPHNFLQFEIVTFSDEREHLKEATEKDYTELKKQIAEMKSKGNSLREIGHKLGISHTMVRKITLHD